MLPTSRAAVLPENVNELAVAATTENLTNERAFDWSTFDYEKLLELIQNVVKQVVEEVFPNLITTTQAPITEGT